MAVQGANEPPEQVKLLEQEGAEAAALRNLLRAAEVEVDRVAQVGILADFGRREELLRIVGGELDNERPVVRRFAVGRRDVAVTVRSRLRKHSGLKHGSIA